LKREFPSLDVTLIESSKIPIIGVGEATTTLMPPFLHQQLGIDIVEFYREVRPTWKLGIKFDWGQPGEYDFAYPFGVTCPIEAFAHDGHIGNQSVAALMMAVDRAPIIVADDGSPLSLLPHMKLAYHLDNKPFVAYLAKLGQRAGLRHIDAEIKDVVTTHDRDSVERLILDDGREIRADLFVDASGFRSLLIEKALGSPFISFASTLLCDTAVVGELPQAGAIQPYTTAQTMDAGWCWRIPIEGEDHRGYVHSAAHLTVEQARAEMRAKNPQLGDTWTVRFRSGRHQEFWKGNTVALGNAYGFVEPLQSTALHMVIVEIAYLVGGLRAASPDRSFANRSVAAHWDFLRWLLGIHYKFNQKSDTQFWRDCRESVDVSGLQPLLDRFRTTGPWDEEANARHATGDPSFSFQGLMIMLLGQQVSCPRPPETALMREEWNRRVAESRALVDRAMAQGPALQLLRDRPELLEAFMSSPTSWINLGGETLTGGNPQTGLVHPKSDRPTEERRPYDHLFQGFASQRRSDRTRRS